MNKNFAVKDLNRKVVITCDQNVVTARIYDGNDKVATGIATCNPEDGFNFRVGAELAMKRAFEGDVNRAVKEPKEKFRKITRTPKAGDYVKVIRSDYPFDDSNTFLKIDKVITDVYGDATLIFVHVKSYPNSAGVKSKLGPFFDLFLDNIVPYALSMNELEFYEKVK